MSIKDAMQTFLCMLCNCIMWRMKQFDNRAYVFCWWHAFSSLWPLKQGFFLHLQQLDCYDFNGGRECSYYYWFYFSCHYLHIFDQDAQVHWLDGLKAVNENFAHQLLLATLFNIRLNDRLLDLIRCMVDDVVIVVSLAFLLIRNYDYMRVCFHSNCYELFS